MSILIPTYGRERLLRQALQSARQQTWRQLEIVVQDNCSPDGTATMVTQVAAADPRVRLVRNPENVGMAPNIRTALAQARGELVKYLMDDDLLLPTAVETLARPLLARPDLAIAFSKRLVIDEHGTHLPGLCDETLAPGPAALPGRALGDHVLRSQNNLIGEPTTVLFRRGDAERLGDPFRWGSDHPEILVDLTAWLRLLAGRDAFYTPEPQSCLRWHGGQFLKQPGRRLQAAVEWRRMIAGAPAYGYLADPFDQLDALLSCLRGMVAGRGEGGTEAAALLAEVGEGGRELAGVAARAAGREPAWAHAGPGPA